ncbi:mechanosensitive ion channel [Candidatus Cytomitobacter indipagum]|uniref:Mechanosensitive ion channel n=1 Tax=Candidatus Cytomitobacter indipagum TaxID=2601575 RepID=A0A5C0UFP6_9PROT|nr:mechanosensitive ion channel domain-containing protein [Candidatus Cytomitobacter indipagum]QEK37874.1 mechanosensitive ion channel [Candidatus Cytomitobacter indipagum]
MILKIIKKIVLFSTLFLFADNVEDANNSMDQKTQEVAVQEEDKINALGKKIDELQKEIGKISESLNGKAEIKQVKQEEEKKHKTLILNIIRTIQIVYKTLMKSIKFVFTNKDTNILIKNAFKDLLKLALFSLASSYIIFALFKKIMQYYCSLYKNKWHAVALDFSASVFLTSFLLLINLLPELELIISNNNAFSHNEMKFLFVTLTRVIFSALIIYTTRIILSYSKNKIILNMHKPIMHNMISICIAWSTFDIMKHFIAIYEINQLNSEVVKDISLIANFFYTLILVHALITLRQKLKHKFENRNIWVKNFTSLQSMSLVVIYIMIIFWIDLNISYKLTRAFVSMILWPSILISSTLSRKYIINYIRSLNYMHRSKLNKMYLNILSIIKKSIAPITILITLQIWGISLYKNAIVIVNQFALDKMLGLFYLSIATFTAISFTKHVLVNWLVSKIKKNQDNERKFEILFNILTSSFKSLIWFITFLGSLSIFGYNTSQIIPALGVFSAGLSFSIRDMITDLLNGLFIIMDNTIMVGDLIIIDGKNAKVEDMNLRYMEVRRDDGTLITIPYHRVNEVFNKSRNFMAVIMNVAVKYDTDPEKAMETMHEGFNLLRNLEMFRHKVFVPLEMRGVSELNGIYYSIQAKLKVMPGYQFKAQRAFNKIIKELFDENGIQMPTEITLGHLNNTPSTITKLPESLT